MGTDLFNWFGMDLVPLLFKTTPSGSRVQLGLRSPATKARTRLRKLEDVMARLCPGVARKRTAGRPGGEAQKSSLSQQELQTINTVPYADSRTTLYCMLKTNKHLLCIFPSVV